MKQEDDLLRKNFKVFKRQNFRRGFLYKKFSIKQLITDPIAVRPTVDEISNFAKIIDEGRSSGTPQGMTKGGGRSNSKKNEDNSSGDELTGEKLKLMSIGKTSDFSKGDKIRVVAGDLTGINGQVVSMEIDTGFITFIPIGLEGFTSELKLEVKNVVKYFEPGDHVRVIDGRYAGETGLVISSETNDKDIVFSNIALL